MAKTTSCPFTHSSCTECALYRGRHHYLSFPRQGREGCTDEPREDDSVNLRALEKIAVPWAGKDYKARNEPKIRLKVIDMESAATKICEINDAKTWDWNNPVILRLIDGGHVNSLDSLIGIVYYKAEKGYEEVEVYEAPRFMLLAGG